jgi:hypothetical protein
MLFTALTSLLAGQDAATVNSKIVKVEFENQKVRISPSASTARVQLKCSASLDQMLW